MDKINKLIFRRSCLLSVSEMRLAVSHGADYCRSVSQGRVYPISPSESQVYRELANALEVEETP